MTNRDLAERARQLAGSAPSGSLDRKAYGCAAVALATTSTPTAARKVLAGWDGPPGVIESALAVLGQIDEQLAGRAGR